MCLKTHTNKKIANSILLHLEKSANSLGSVFSQASSEYVFVALMFLIRNQCQEGHIISQS